MQQDEYLQVNNSNRKPDYKGSISPTPDCYLLHVQDGKIAEIGLNDYIDYARNFLLYPDFPQGFIKRAEELNAKYIGKPVQQFYDDFKKANGDIIITKRDSKFYSCKNCFKTYKQSLEMAKDSIGDKNKTFYMEYQITIKNDAPYPPFHQYFIKAKITGGEIVDTAYSNRKSLSPRDWNLETARKTTNMSKKIQEYFVGKNLNDLAELSSRDILDCPFIIDKTSYDRIKKLQKEDIDGLQRHAERKATQVADLLNGETDYLQGKQKDFSEMNFSDRTQYMRDHSENKKAIEGQNIALIKEMKSRNLVK